MIVRPPYETSAIVCILIKHSGNHMIRNINIYISNIHSIRESAAPRVPGDLSELLREERL